MDGLHDSHHFYLCFGFTHREVGKLSPTQPEPAIENLLNTTITLITVVRWWRVEGGGWWYVVTTSTLSHLMESRPSQLQQSHTVTSKINHSSTQHSDAFLRQIVLACNNISTLPPTFWSILYNSL